MTASRGDLNDVCAAIAKRVADGHREIDARDAPGGAMTAPAFYLVVDSLPVRTTARKTDYVLRGVLLLGDLGEEAVRQGRDYMASGGLVATIQGDRTDPEQRTLGGLVDDIACTGEWTEIGGDEYQQLEGWAASVPITICGRTT